MDTTTAPAPQTIPEATAVRLARLRSEMDRIAEAEYDPWRYEPGLRPEDLVPPEPRG